MPGQCRWPCVRGTEKPSHMLVPERSLSREGGHYVTFRRDHCPTSCRSPTSGWLGFGWFRFGWFRFAKPLVRIGPCRRLVVVHSLTALSTGLYTPHRDGRQVEVRHPTRASDHPAGRTKKCGRKKKSAPLGPSGAAVPGISLVAGVTEVASCAVLAGRAALAGGEEGS